VAGRGHDRLGDRHAGQPGAGDPYAAMMHDAGKLEVPATVLRKGRAPPGGGSPGMRRFRSERPTGTGRQVPGYSRTGPRSLPPPARAELHAGNTQHAPIWSYRPSPRRTTTSVQNGGDARGYHRGRVSLAARRARWRSTVRGAGPLQRPSAPVGSPLGSHRSNSVS
jgi:hypothetical protein